MVSVCRKKDQFFCLAVELIDSQPVICKYPFCVKDIARFPAVSALWESVELRSVRQGGGDFRWLVFSLEVCAAIQADGMPDTAG